jgi:tetratricopeptide (TPR) repeat protein
MVKSTPVRLQGHGSLASFFLLAILCVCTPPNSLGAESPTSTDDVACYQAAWYPSSRQSSGPAKSRVRTEGADDIRSLEVRSPNLSNTRNENRAEVARYAESVESSQRWPDLAGQVPHQQVYRGFEGTHLARAAMPPKACYEAVSHGRWDEAIEACSRQIASSPDSGPAYSNRGLAYLQKNELDRALADFDMAARIAPQEPSILINRSSVQHKMGRSDLALADLRKAEVLMESGANRSNVAKRASQFFSIGAAYLEVKQYDLALQVFTKANKLSPSARNQERIGECHEGRGNLREAARHFKRAVEMDPNNARYYRKLGAAYYWLGSYDQALKALKDGLLKSHSDAERALLNFDLAYTYVAKGDYNQTSQILGERRTIGVTLSQEKNGIRVDAVRKGGPAELAGLKGGDLMVELNGEPLSNRTIDEFTDCLQRMPFGSNAQVRIFRDGSHLSKDICVGVTAHTAAAAAQSSSTIPESEAQPRATSAASAKKGPSVEIHRLAISPTSVSPGSAFDLTFDFSVTTEPAGSTKVPVEYSYQILEEENVVFASKATQLEVAPRVRTQRVVHLTARKKIGRYTLRVSLRCGERTAELSASLNIE